MLRMQVIVLRCMKHLTNSGSFKTAARPDAHVYLMFADESFVIVEFLYSCNYVECEYHHLVAFSCKILLLPSATKLRRLCFYTCLSFCSQGSSASMHAGIPPPGSRHPPPLDQAPPGAGNPSPGSRHPPEQAPPPTRQPPEQTPPQTRHPPRSRHPPSRDGYCCGRYASYLECILVIICTFSFLR